ncbi:19064_t:CDS:2 [Funneliformis geosporum]|uniref:19064_t:CDS:1 n=1 Tax=Funneliformis geosporum TaxID=1117311 RepID=A0A9W4WZ26_9GLOM|nr:19064_t:CDS:2 [Funneliformis geosporum]
MNLLIFVCIIILLQRFSLIVKADEVEIVNPQENTEIEINKSTPIDYVVKQNGMAILKSIQFSSYEYNTNPPPECSNDNVENNSNNLIYSKNLIGLKKCALILIEKNIANVTREVDFKDKLEGEINWFVDGAMYTVGKQYYIKVSLELIYRNTKGIWDNLMVEFVNGPLLAKEIQGTDVTSGAKHRKKRNFNNSRSK